MNFLKGYVGALSDLVSNAVREAEETDAAEQVEQTESESLVKSTEVTETVYDVPCVESTDRTATQRSGLLDWVPRLKRPTGENAVVYYMNQLASLGSHETSADSKDAKATGSADGDQDAVITADIPGLEPPTPPVTDSKVPGTTTESGGAQLEDALIDWLSSLSSRTGEVWNQMKQDFGEVVSVVSKEPRDTVARTASSVRERLAAMADAALKIDPTEFALLPEPTKPQDETGDRLAPEEKVAAPPNLSDLPSLSSLRSDVSHLFNGLMSSLFGTDDDQPVATKDRREARLQIIRADPATYEFEPAPPPVHLGLHSYTDWRAAYFDEATCQPRPGIPLCGTRDVANEDRDLDSMLEPPHPSPEELLDRYPFMRTYLTQLVRIEGQPGGKGLSDADFWSRYYYRVWLLDVTEQRRQRLAERVASTTTLKAAGESGSGNGAVQRTSEQADEQEIDEANDWLVDSDAEVESGSPTVSTTETTKPPVVSELVPPRADSRASEPASTDSDLHSRTELPAVAQAKSLKLAGKSRRKRGKKRSGSNHEVEPHESDSESPTHQLGPREPMGSVRGLEENTSDTAGIDPKLMACPSDALPVESIKSGQLAAESDDLFTSGSSSVVVLSNSEDESVLQPPASSKANPTQADQTGSTVAPNMSGLSLADWGDDDIDKSADDDGNDKPVQHDANPATTMSSEPFKSDELPDETDDWENWS